MSVERESDALDRRHVVRFLLAERPDRLLVVSGLGAPTYDVAAAGDHPLNFYLWGAMGSAATLGLGLALARPDHRVLVVTGDGELLMGLGALATIAVRRPENLALLVLDNETYGETGGQESHTRYGVDLSGIARACGFREARLLDRAEGMEPSRDWLFATDGPLLLTVKVGRGDQPRVLPSRDGHHLRRRFRDALLSGESGGR